MFFFENALPCQVDCQQLAGDTCDVTGLAEFMVEVVSGGVGCVDAPEEATPGRWFWQKVGGTSQKISKSWGFPIQLIKVVRYERES